MKTEGGGHDLFTAEGGGGHHSFTGGEGGIIHLQEGGGGGIIQLQEGGGNHSITGGGGGASFIYRRERHVFEGGGVHLRGRRSLKRGVHLSVDLREAFIKCLTI